MRGLLACIVALGLTSQATQVITVNDPRPLSEAIRSLEKATGLPITYEDPSYSYSADIVDRSGSFNHKPGVKVLLPKGGALIFPFMPSEALDRPGTAKVLQRLVSTFNTTYPDGAQFTLLDQGGLFHVFPTSVRSSTGVVGSHTSPLDVPLTVVEKDVNGLEALHDIFAAIKATTGTDVFEGQIPMNVLSHRTVSISNDSETGRTVLTLLLQTVGKGAPPLSWQMLTGVGENPAYYFNAHQVQQ